MENSGEGRGLLRGILVPARAQVSSGRHSLDLRIYMWEVTTRQGKACRRRRTLNVLHERAAATCSSLAATLLTLFPGWSDLAERRVDPVPISGGRKRVRSASQRFIVRERWVAHAIPVSATKPSKPSKPALLLSWPSSRISPEQQNPRPHFVHYYAPCASLRSTAISLGREAREGLLQETLIHASQADAYLGTVLGITLGRGQPIRIASTRPLRSSLNTVIVR